MFKKKLQKSFYRKQALVLAPKLLGKILVRKIDTTVLSGIIVEVEAYGGPEDQASHAYTGMRQRNRVMFNEGGSLYVYFTYGNHFCANVVSGREGSGEAVLIRALEPIAGIEQMRQNRAGKAFNSAPDLINLTNGPGKLCKALDITGELNGVSLLDDEVYLTEGKRITPDEIIAGPRIGITKSTGLPWRFSILNNPFVSRK